MASEYARNAPSSDDDNDEGINVQLDANVTKHRVTLALAGR